MTENKQNNNDRTDRRPDCVSEIRMGNSVLTVSGFFTRLFAERETGIMPERRHMERMEQMLRADVYKRQILRIAKKPPSRAKSST